MRKKVRNVYYGEIVESGGFLAFEGESIKLERGNDGY